MVAKKKKFGYKKTTKFKFRYQNQRRKRNLFFVVRFNDRERQKKSYQEVFRRFDGSIADFCCCCCSVVKIFQLVFSLGKKNAFFVVVVKLVLEKRQKKKKKVTLSISAQIIYVFFLSLSSSWLMLLSKIGVNRKILML